MWKELVPILLASAMTEGARAQTVTIPSSRADETKVHAGMPALDPASPALIGRGVNFGNMLEAPNEGEWGLTVRAEFFDRVVEAGFEHIRLPVSWTTHAGLAPPYTIDPVFLNRVDWCIDQALARGLKIIVNVHHYDALNANPVAEKPRALAIWNQIATRMRTRPQSVYFEVLNEPHGVFNDNPALWNDYLRDALQVIRTTNPTRWVLAGPVGWNSIGYLNAFSPPADRRLIATLHYYEPFAFTHQGATWVDPVPPTGVSWNPALFTIAGPWESWSWETTIQPSASGLSVEYKNGWAGLSFHRGPAISGVRRVEFRTDRAMQFKVTVSGSGKEQDFWLQSAAGNALSSVLVQEGFGPIDRITWQNATPAAQAPFIMSEIQVFTSAVGGQAEPIIVTQRGNIDRAMAWIAEWSRLRGMPAHLGEFGAFSTAGMDDRVAWTRAVRESAEAHGIPWSYWEFGSGFGIYDPQANTWRAPLLDALTGE
jgi:hypothetical protein